MASVRPRPRRNGKTTYQVRWKINGNGKDDDESFEFLEDAERFRLLVEEAGNNLPESWVRGHGFVVTVLEPEQAEPAAQQSESAISQADFDAITTGMTRAQVDEIVAPASPQDAQEFEQEGVLDENAIKSSCIYFNKEGGEFGDIFQLCLDGEGATATVSSKNSYQPRRRRRPGTWWVSGLRAVRASTSASTIVTLGRSRPDARR